MFFITITIDVAKDSPIDPLELKKDLEKPIYYTTKEDKVYYQNTPHQKNRHYTRLATTRLDSDQQLFLGKTEYDFITEGKAIPIVCYDYFVLDQQTKMIRGGEHAPGFYTAQIIGLDQNVNGWPRPENETH